MVSAIRLVSVAVLWGSLTAWSWAQSPDAPAVPPAAQESQEPTPAEVQGQEPVPPPPKTLPPPPEGPLPTYSLEVTEINGTPIPGGPRSEFTVSPGDQFTAKIFVRDWSINGEKLRSFQATLDPSSFASGQSGKIEPIRYGAGENRENAFLDETDPMYVHRGMHTIPAVDTSGPDYRWLSVLYDISESPVSPMDGTKYACGTVHMWVTDDASGTFTIKLYSTPDLTMLLDPTNELIPYLQIEPLTLHVASSSEWLRIRSSTPASGSVAAQLLGKDEKACRWNSIKLTSTGDASKLQTSDFQASDGTSNPPRIEKVEVDPKAPGAAVLRLSRGISPGRWTKIVHKGSQSSTTIGCLPGDVNGDAVLNGRDVTTLIEVLNGGRDLPPEQTDLNGDSKTTSADLVGLVDMVTSGPAGRRIASLP